MLVLQTLLFAALSTPSLADPNTPELKHKRSSGVIQASRNFPPPDQVLASISARFKWPSTDLDLAVDDQIQTISSDCPSFSTQLATTSATILAPRSTFGASTYAPPSTSALSGTLAPSSAVAPSSGLLPSSTSAASSVYAPYANTTSATTATSEAASSPSYTASVSAVADPSAGRYVSPVTIGGQQFRLGFDTGSADLWVLSNGLPSNVIGNHTVYDPSASSTFVEYTNATWQIYYGDGSEASGNVGWDDVQIGGLTVQHQCVELADAASGSFETSSVFDGLLGLGFKSINNVRPQKQPTWFANVAPYLAENLFTCDLDVTSDTGTYEFGYIDSTRYVGDIHYTTVNSSNGYWGFEASTYAIHGGVSDTNITAHCSTCNYMIADTGSSLLILDEDVAEAYYAQVSNVQSSTQGYAYPCNTTLPSFTIAIGDSGYNATINGADMTYGLMDSGLCLGILQSNGNTAPQILGDAFLKQYFTVFDAGNLSFGLAEQS